MREPVSPCGEVGDFGEPEKLLSSPCLVCHGRESCENPWVVSTAIGSALRCRLDEGWGEQVNLRGGTDGRQRGPVPAGPLSSVPQGGHILLPVVFFGV